MANHHAPPVNVGPRLPAVLFCQANAAGVVTGAVPPTIASLTALDRLLVAVHRAGCGPIHVVRAGPLPRLRRAPALGIRFTVGPDAPVFDRPAFVAADTLLLTVWDVRRLVEQCARLTLDGKPMPAGVAARCTGRLEEDLASAPGLAPESVVASVHDAASARTAARALWASLGSDSDGTVDRYFNRPVGRFLSKVLIHTPVTPNQISIAATILGVGAAVLFGVGTTSTASWGAVLLQVSAIIDCVDGDVARVVFKESALGKWLDLVGDQVVHVSVFVAIGIGLWRAGTDAPVLALAASAGVGVICSFLVILRSLLNPALAGNSALQRMIDATTNRDYSLLLLGLTLVDRLVWFLWMTAFGVHVFWVVALSLQLSGGRARRHVEA